MRAIRTLSHSAAGRCLDSCNSILPSRLIIRAIAALQTYGGPEDTNRVFLSEIGSPSSESPDVSKRILDKGTSISARFRFRIGVAARMEDDEFAHEYGGDRQVQIDMYQTPVWVMRGQLWCDQTQCEAFARVNAVIVTPEFTLHKLYVASLCDL